MKIKPIKVFIILSILIISTFAIVSIQNQNIYIKNYIKKQISFFKTPLPFIHKIQYFYDRAIIFYLNKQPKKAILNLEISKSLIPPLHIPEIKNINSIINETINNIKNNKKFNYFQSQKSLYENLISIVNRYYQKTYKVIKSLNNYMIQNDNITQLLQIVIFLLAVVAILSYILYSLKEQFKNDSLKDHLTNTFNRRFFFEEIKNLPNNIHSLVMTDIDYFKKINDTYGHDMGDFVLKEFTKLIKENIRKEDKIFRWGGEEFIILFKNMNANQTKKKIEYIKNLIENHDFNGIRITASFGIKEIKGKPTQEDLKILDDALYLSKEKGRNRITVF